MKERLRLCIGCHNLYNMNELIKIKTLNNLTDEQRRLLDGMLTDLRLNYVDESKKDAISS